MQYEIRGFTSVHMTITVNYTYSVEHNTGLFQIELNLDMLDTCFGLKIFLFRLLYRLME
jgi:hypothetical protein